MNFKKSTESSAPLFAGRKILPFDKNLQLQAGKLLWKAANDTLCPSLNPLFNMRDDGLSFHLPHKRLNVSQNSVVYSGVKLWNAIPIDLRSSTSLACFKQKYKDHLNGGPHSHNNNGNVQHNHINNNRRFDNNNYGQLNANRRNARFQSRWNPGSNNLI